jgi:hypothetical protein
MTNKEESLAPVIFSTYVIQNHKGREEKSN